MPVKLSAIEGLMIEKVNEDQKYRAEIGEFNMGRKIGYNKAIDLQGSKQTGLNRERLIELIKKLLLNPKKVDRPKPTIAELEKLLNSEEINSWRLDTNGELMEMRPSYSIGTLADAIIHEESTLIEVKEEN